MKIVYVSGRYRARTIFGKIINILKARSVAVKLWREGWIDICPHMNTSLFPEDNINYIEGDCELVKRCDAIYLLKSWQKSKGSRQELAVAIDNNLEILWE